MTPVARARLTANFTQSRIGASLVWHMRQMSPSLNVCLQAFRRPIDDSAPCPPEESSNVLSCDPYSSAFLAIRPTLGTLPIVVTGRRHRSSCSQSSALIDTGVAAVGNDGFGVLQLAVRVPHLTRRADHAGIEASMITSLGTWRLVMPLSELTIAKRAVW